MLSIENAAATTAPNMIYRWSWRAISWYLTCRPEVAARLDGTWDTVNAAPLLTGEAMRLVEARNALSLVGVEPEALLGFRGTRHPVSTVLIAACAGLDPVTTDECGPNVTLLVTLAALRGRTVFLNGCCGAPQQEVLRDVWGCDVCASPANRTEMQMANAPALLPA